MNDLSTQGRMNRRGYTVSPALIRKRELRVEQWLESGQRTADRFPHSPTVLHSGNECLVEAASRLFGHAETAVTQTNRHVLRCATKPRDLVVMDCGGAIH